MTRLTKFLLLASSLGAVTWAQINTGEASGEIRTIANGTQVYFTGPADSDTGVLFLTDIFGINFTNTQLVADSYGARGYYTIVPDLFRGDPVPIDRPADYDLAAWRARNQPPAIDPVIALTLADIAANTHIQRLGVVGYCFGGKYVARWLGQGDDAIVAGFTAHPSDVTQEEWAGVAAPLSIANAELDTTFPLAAARLAEDTLRSNASVQWQFTTYSDVPHGFGIRANVSLPRQVFAKEQAFVQAVTWFDTFVRPANVSFGVGGGASAAAAGVPRTFAEEHAAVVASV